MTMFPEAHNLAAGGTASASPVGDPRRPPSLVFSKQRTTVGWLPDTSKATFTASWPRPPAGPLRPALRADIQSQRAELARWHNIANQ